MKNLYDDINLILKKHKIIISKKIEEDLMQECILAVLEARQNNQNQFNNIVVRCAYNLIYRSKKDKKLINIDNLQLSDSYDLLENIIHQYVPKKNKASDNLLNYSTNNLDIKELIRKKGDYTHTELAKLMKITRSHLLRAIRNNKLGIKSVMRLKKIQYYEKKKATLKILKIIAIENLSYNDLSISKSTWYYGLKKGFTYSQAYKISSCLKQKFNIIGVLNDIY
jgi:hypothetical protein